MAVKDALGIVLEAEAAGCRVVQVDVGIDMDVVAPRPPGRAEVDVDLGADAAELGQRPVLVTVQRLASGQQRDDTDQLVHAANEQQLPCRWQDAR